MRYYLNSGTWQLADFYTDLACTAANAAVALPGVDDDVICLVDVTDLAGDRTVKNVELRDSYAAGYTLYASGTIWFSGNFDDVSSFTVGTIIAPRIIFSGTHTINAYYVAYGGTIGDQNNPTYTTIIFNGSFEDVICLNSGTTVYATVIASGMFHGTTVNASTSLYGNIIASGTFTDGPIVSTGSFTGNILASGSGSSAGVLYACTLTGNLVYTGTIAPLLSSGSIVSGGIGAFNGIEGVVSPITNGGNYSYELKSMPVNFATPIPQLSLLNTGLL